MWAPYFFVGVLMDIKLCSIFSTKGSQVKAVIVSGAKIRNGYTVNKEDIR